VCVWGGADVVCSSITTTFTTNNTTKPNTTNHHRQDNYGQKLDRTWSCYDKDESVVLRITDTCPCALLERWGRGALCVWVRETSAVLFAAMLKHSHARTQQKTRHLPRQPVLEQALVLQRPDTF
jgi:hypothetical protein